MNGNEPNETKLTKYGTTIDAHTGKWVKGTRSPNPAGRPTAAVEIQRRSLMLDVWTDDRFRMVLKVIAAQAEAGCRTSQEMMLRYSVPVASKLEISMQAEPLADLTDDEITELLEETDGIDTDTDAA